MGIIKKQSIQSTVLQYLGAAIGFVNRIFIFTEFLSTQEVGLANILLTTALMLSQIAGLGFGTMTLKFFPYFNDRQRGHHGFVFWMLAIPTAGFVLISLLIWIFQVPVLAYFSTESPLFVGYFWYLLPLGLMTLYFDLFDTYLRSLYKSVVPILFREVIQRLLIMACVILYGLHLIDLDQFVLLYVVLISSVTLMMLAYLVFLRQLHIRLNFSWRMSKLYRKALIFAGFTVLGNVSAIIIYNIDSLMLASYEGMESVGIYTTAFYASALIMIPWRALQKISAPKVADLWQQRDMAGMDALYKRTSVINFLVGCTLFGGMVIGLDVLFDWLPQDYQAGYGVILIVGLTRVLDMLTGLNGLILLTSKYYKVDLFSNFSLMILAIVLNMVLIPILHIEGAAWATAIAIFAANLFRLIFVWAKFNLQPFTWSILGILLLVAGAFAAQHYLFLSLDGLIGAILKSILFGGLMLAGGIALRILPKRFWRILSN